MRLLAHPIYPKSLGCAMSDTAERDQQGINVLCGRLTLVLGVPIIGLALNGGDRQRWNACN